MRDGDEIEAALGEVAALLGRLQDQQREIERLTAEAAQLEARLAELRRERAGE